MKLSNFQLHEKFSRVSLIVYLICLHGVLELSDDMRVRYGSLETTTWNSTEASYQSHVAVVSCLADIVMCGTIIVDIGFCPNGDNSEFRSSINVSM